MTNKTNLTISLVASVLFFITAGQAVGDGWWPPSNVEIAPESPTSSDVVVITLSGMWPDSCIPIGSVISVAGNEIYFDIIAHLPANCLTVMTSWERRRSVGPLAAGTYTVYTKLLGDPFVPETYTQVAEFTVTETNTYVFDPDQSTVVLTGGFGGHIHETHSITGQFQLTVDFDTNTASFDSVDANLSEGYGWLGEYDLGTLFYMTELVGTVISDTEIYFEGQTKSGVTDHINCEIIDDSIHMTGFFWDGVYDGIFYNLDAVASKKKHVYYIDAVDGNDNNNGLSPEGAFATIQKAVDTAKSGDRIIVGQGVYSGERNHDIDFSAKAISIRSTDPNDPEVVTATIIDCQQNGSGFRFRSNEPPSASVSGLTIINASFSAIYCHDYSSPTIDKCVIMYNQGFIGGGILCSSFSNPTIRNCTISGNTAVDDGGGIYCLANSNPTVTNCVISDNSAGDYGGGIDISHSNPTILNCTITGNSAVQRGGGVNVHHIANVDITNSILWDNIASSGSQIAILDASCSVSYSNVQGGQGDVYINIRPGHGCDDCTLDWGLGNIDTDPCFVDPANGDYHLKSEGWRWDAGFNPPRWTYDYDTSLCIDAGNPGCPLGDELMTVPPDPTNEYGENIRINMGAYGGTAEASMPPYDWALLGDLSNDGTVDYVDLAGQMQDWLTSANKQPGDLNRDGIVNMADFALLAESWLAGTE